MSRERDLTVVFGEFAKRALATEARKGEME